MCNLYSITRSQDAMRRLFEVADDLTGNLPPMPAVFPDMLAPVVRVADGIRRLEPMRWGMPGPPQFGGHARDEHPQHVEKPALASVAWASEPVPRSCDVLLRVGADQAEEDADMVRAR